VLKKKKTMKIRTVGGREEKEKREETYKILKKQD
jgi:hypothetical protein